MSKRLSLFYLSTIFLLLLTGCISAPFTGPAPDGTHLRVLPLLDRATPGIWHPSGNSITAGQKGMIRYDLRSGQSTQIDWKQPSQLVWSPDSKRLAAAYRIAGTTQLILRDADGNPLAETVLPGALDKLLWSKEAGLLVITARLKTYSFGGDFSLMLSRWDGLTPPQTAILHNTTIKPSTSRDWEQGAIAGSQATLSPDQDEILYLQLHDPPAFQGSYRLTLRHLETGAEKEIEALPIAPRSAHFIDSDRILVSNGAVGSLVFSLWKDEPPLPLSYSGEIIAISPAGHYWLIGDQLLQDGRIIGHFPGANAATFSPDGTRLLLQIDTHWYLLDGLAEPARPALSSADSDKLRQLRNWRSRSLITPQEYQSQKARIGQP